MKAGGRQRRGDHGSPQGRYEQRYYELLARHVALLGRMSDLSKQETAFHRLGWYGLQRSKSGMAMFRDGRVVAANQRWHELASAIRQPVGWIVAGDGMEQREYTDLGTLCVHELAILPPGENSRMLACRRRDRQQVLRVRIERVLQNGDEPVGLVLADDVSTEVAREAEMAALRDAIKKREQMSALGRLAAGVAHDLGNALNALALRAYAVAKHADDEGKKHARGMHDALEMMRETLDRLDRFSGRRERPLKPMPLRPAIVTAVDMAGLGGGALGRGKPRIRVALELPPRLPLVLGDKSELTNMFVNLLLNARDAMPEGGTITVRATAGDKLVTVHVCDEGTGFRREHLDRVFEPFFTTKGARGRGLGLSLAYGLMQAMGGSIRAGNRPEGGAEIVVELPAARGGGGSVAHDGRRRGGRVGVGRRGKRPQ